MNVSYAPDKKYVLSHKIISRYLDYTLDDQGILKKTEISDFDLPSPDKQSPKKSEGNEGEGEEEQPEYQIR